MGSGKGKKHHPSSSFSSNNITGRKEKKRKKVAHTSMAFSPPTYSEMQGVSCMNIGNDELKYLEELEGTSQMF